MLSHVYLENSIRSGWLSVITKQENKNSDILVVKLHPVKISNGIDKNVNKFKI